ncbi:MAG: hypothetical protein ACRC06_15085 [Waterburya sp.]
MSVRVISNIPVHYHIPDKRDRLKLRFYNHHTEGNRAILVVPSKIDSTCIEGSI